MNLENLRLYCLSKKGATEDQPFGPDTLCFKVMDKLFALTDFHSNPTSVNLKCDPEKAVQLREEHACVQPGFHMNKKHWNTVVLDGSVPDTLYREWIDDSYELVVRGLSRTQQAALKTV
jgi:predicted DNA-binding protein (MmcQ/YjbR family)